jgi:hypothetical protein
MPRTKSSNTKSYILEQLRTTHNVKDWFVPVNTALEDVTPDQAKWTDGSGNHSIGQLASHLIFWNLQQLYSFKKLPQPKFDGNNDETLIVLTVPTGKQQFKNLIACLTSHRKSG